MSSRLMGPIFGIRDVTFDKSGNLVVETHEPPGNSHRFIAFEKADLAALKAALDKGPPKPETRDHGLVLVAKNWLKRRRPSNYHELSSQEQWEIDKKLGILDD